MEISEKYEESIDMKQVADLPIDIVEKDRILSGEVVTIDNDFAYVNVGIKTDGRVNLNEFSEKPQIGDIIDVLLVNKRLIDGMYVFSKTAAEKEKKWENFLTIYRDGIDRIQGAIGDSNNNGFVINCEEIDGFLPFSHAADLRMKKNANSKAPFWFKILNIDEKRHNILLSRKDFIEEEKVKLWDNFLSKYKTGDKITGKVKKFVEFGAFIEIEGIEALLHKNDMSWNKIFKPKKLIELNEEKEFLILNIDREEEKISLGLKQLTDDPWASIEERYKAGDVISGEVVTIANFGVFVQVEEGIDGFIDLGELSWTKKNINPKDLFEKGQKIEAKIIDIKKDEKKIPLSYKALFPNPWDSIDERFKVGAIHKSEIKKIVNFGMFVELEDGIDGLIHISDITWDDKLKDPTVNYKTGESVEYRILEIKKDEMKIACGMKQLQKSPWELINEKFPAGSRVSGTVSGIVPFGLFVKIDDDIEGLVHISEVSHKRIENIADHFKEGDEVNVEVLGIDIERKRLSLSMKKYDAALEKEELNKLLNETSSKKVTLGDFIQIKLGE
ncbi:MAG: S1 RNA-binding domain-containing protein [Spirochaetes bacterium]|nr:S1 RNA-binding domain-containing protein [Spirochaetota bacterium]